jgi:hypothetical protein
MKTVCAWCGSTIKITCHCGAPLLHTTYVGSTFDLNATVCFNGETPLNYTQSAIENMPISHGICRPCFSLSASDRDELILNHREANHDLPDSLSLDEISAGKTAEENHERSTRRPARTTAMQELGKGRHRQTTHHVLR